jgi:hypothetical protein
MRGPRAATALALILLVLSTLVPGAGAAEGPAATRPGLPDLPAGWSLEIGARGTVLAYAPAEALPVHDARPEFRDGDRILGYPMYRQGRLELALNAVMLAGLESPSAWLSGRRLDGPTPEEPIVREPVVTPPPAPRALTGSADPGQRGPYTTTTLSYELPGLDIEGFTVPVEVIGEVVTPQGAPGPRPLVLFLHGRHSTCYGVDPEPYVTSDWPCPEGTLPIPSHQGYRYVADLLASQGYITVSISANGISGQDDWVADAGAAARSALIRHHLARWVQWAGSGGDPWGGRFLGAVDLRQVVLVGHSRGGEGIERAAVDSVAADGYRIVGLVPIGPTAFGRQVGAGIATAVILPYCDGDVSDLQGQQYVDLSRDLTGSRALRSAVMVLGANHNFFNTQWTPGLAVAPADDDWLWAGSDDDPTCGAAGGSRLTPAQQQAVGATYIAALARVAVERDPNAAALLDGSRVRAASAGAARVLTHALGGYRRLVYRPRLTDFLSTVGFSARVCRGYLGETWPPLGGGLVSECAAAASLTRLPHWLPMMGAESAPSPLALDLQWWRTGGTVRLDLAQVRDLAWAQHLDLRLAVDASSGPVQLALRLVDAQGAVAELPPVDRVAPLRGDQSPLGKAWAQTLRFSLEGVGGIDLSAITAFELVARTPRGRAWLLDVHGRRPGATASRPIALPQVSVDSMEVSEGGPGSRTVTLPLQIRGEIVRPAVLWVSVSDPTGSPQSYRLVLPPGTTEAGIPITIEGNDQYDPYYLGDHTVTLRALSQVTTGEYVGTLRVVEDDPAPTLTFEATRGRVAEGDTLVFTATLSAPISADLWYSLTLAEVPGVPTLWTDDVTPEFLSLWTGWVPDPPVPLWQTIYPSLNIPTGATTATFEIPTVADGIVEGREVILVTLEAWEDPLLPMPITVRGTVRDG